ncbi:MAG: TolC family protein [Thermoguttaceae bacterium]|jgi:cobalt-zinc-cadmium efflux system outer membrane protein|nr:TolC family protein [Thermoguttaceae bacterium]
MDATSLLRVTLGSALTLCLLRPCAAQTPAPLPDDRPARPPVADTAPLPGAILTPAATEGSAATPVDLRTALELTLARNPDLVAIRQNLPVSSAAMAVAHRFPTSLNPTVSIDVRPWTFEKDTGAGSTPLDTDFTVSWNQPIELGHRRAYREAIARADFNQTQWNVLQAELSALVQTYRLHQTATYRREKLRVARQLADFNRALVETVERQMQANQASAADVSLANVENQATMQQLAACQQDFLAALTELRQQMGIPEYAGSMVPSGPLRVPEPVPPGDEEHLINTALSSRPEIHAAAAQVASSRAAVCLARADRIPIPSVGPVYSKNESGVTFYGLAVSSPIPILNAGGPLVRQREAEYRRDAVALEQTRQRVRAQVKATLAKWNHAQQLVARTQATVQPIQAETARMERLYKAGQTDLLRLLQVRGRLIQADNAQLDALWQATQAYADLLAALGCTPLIGSVDAEPAPSADPQGQ